MHILYNSIKKEHIGDIVPQVTKDEQSENCVLLHEYRGKPLPETPNFPKLTLEKQAKPADWLLSNYIPTVTDALVSERLFKIISSYSTMKMQAFPVPLTTDQGVLPYYILHFLQFATSYINFTETLFQTISFPEMNKSTYQFDSYESFERQRLEKGIKGKVSALFIQSVPYDFFSLEVPSIYVIRNQKLIEEIVRKRITGIELVPLQEGEDFTEKKRSKIARKGLKY
ncbi:MAG: hypothetical protein NXI08_16555 [bacterium]|nr:hypothetical protein [bacterium]